MNTKTTFFKPALPAHIEFSPETRSRRGAIAELCAALKLGFSGMLQNDMKKVITVPLLALLAFAGVNSAFAAATVSTAPSLNVSADTGASGGSGRPDLT